MARVSSRWRIPLPPGGGGMLPALVTVSSLTAIAKLAAAVKVLFIAHRFGIVDELDAFFIAFLLPSFFADIAAASTTAALIPTLVEERERRGREAARRLAGSITVWTLLLLLSTTALSALLSTPLVSLLGSGFSAAKLELTRNLFFWLLPILALTGMGASWRAVLNAEHDYALAAIVPGVTPLVTIGAVVWRADEWGVYALVAGSLAGALLEVMILGAGLFRRKLVGRPRFNASDPATRQVMRQYAPMLGSSMMFSASALVSQAMAAMLGSGGVSALHYGGKLLNVMLAVGPSALATTALPHFAQLAARGASAEAWDTFRSYTRLVLLVTVPLTALLIVLSEPVVRLLFERGEFTSQDTVLVAGVQRFYLLQMPLAMTVALGTRLISSLKANDTLLWGSLVAVISQVLLTRALLQPMGAGGVALAASASVFIYLCYLLGVLFRWKRAEPMPELTRRGVSESADN